MKRIKRINQHTICLLNSREIADRFISGPYVAILNDEMEYGSDLREIDWEADSLEEIVEWCNNY